MKPLRSRPYAQPDRYPFLSRDGVFLREPLKEDKLIGDSAQRSCRVVRFITSPERQWVSGISDEAAQTVLIKYMKILVFECSFNALLPVKNKELNKNKNAYAVLHLC